MMVRLGRWPLVLGMFTPSVAARPDLRLLIGLGPQDTFGCHLVDDLPDHLHMLPPVPVAWMAEVGFIAPFKPPRPVQVEYSASPFEVLPVRSARAPPWQRLLQP